MHKFKTTWIYEYSGWDVFLFRVILNHTCILVYFKWFIWGTDLNLFANVGIYWIEGDSKSTLTSDISMCQVVRNAQVFLWDVRWQRNEGKGDREGEFGGVRPMGLPDVFLMCMNDWSLYADTCTPEGRLQSVWCRHEHYYETFWAEREHCGVKASVGNAEKSHSGPDVPALQLCAPTSWLTEQRWFQASVIVQINTWSDHHGASQVRWYLAPWSLGIYWLDLQDEFLKSP